MNRINLSVKVGIPLFILLPVLTVTALADTLYTGSEVEYLDQNGNVRPYNNDTISIGSSYGGGVGVTADNEGVSGGCSPARIDWGYSGGNWVGFDDTPSYRVRESCKYLFEGLDLPVGDLYLHRKYLTSDGRYQWHESIRVYHNTFEFNVVDVSRVGEYIFAFIQTDLFVVSIRDTQILAGHNCQVRVLDEYNLEYVIGDFNIFSITNFDRNRCDVLIPLSSLPSGDMRIRLQVGQPGLEWMGWRGEVTINLSRSDDQWWGN